MMIKDIFVFQLCKDKPAVQPSFCQPENTKSAPKRYGNTAAGSPKHHGNTMEMGRAAVY